MAWNCQYLGASWKSAVRSWSPSCFWGGQVDASSSLYACVTLHFVSYISYFFSSFRKRKRKHVVHQTKIRKHRQRSTTSYSLRHFPTHNPHSQTPIFPNQPPPTTLPQPQQTNVNAFADHHQNDYDPKLCELKATTNTGLELDNLGMHFQQLKVSTANGGHLDCAEPTQTGRCRGAKRRKCGPVKRFKRETDAGKPVDAQNSISVPVGAVEAGCTRTTGCVGNNSPLKMDDAKTACNIVKILKPIGYSSSLSDNMQDVLVTFMAMRFVT